VHVVTGVLKDYAWGITDGLMPWWGEATGEPQAELWFGAHVNGSSPLQGDSRTLAEVVSDSEIPLLVKILAAGKPLSVQVHPDADLAQRGFAKHPEIYCDAGEKTELLMALESFEAFAGWRDYDQAADVLAFLPGTEAAVAALRDGDRPRALEALQVLAEQVEDLPGWIAGLPNAAHLGQLPLAQVEAYATVAREYPDDRGAPLTVLLDYLALEPGDAVYLSAGIPHSYISGIGLEVMTNSDNVLRLGLTPKAVYPEQARGALDWVGRPEVFRARPGATVAPSGAPFAVELLEGGSTSAETASGVSTMVTSGAYRVILCLEGECKISVGEGDSVLTIGQAAVLMAGEPDADVRIKGRAGLVRAAESALIG
jgi:mannose-6-phosphate isomerase